MAKPKLDEYRVSLMLTELWIDVPIKAASLEDALVIGREMKFENALIVVGDGDVIDYTWHVRGVYEG
jgi:hypothetical protein